jgi:hypothetical protein
MVTFFAEGQAVGRQSPIPLSKTGGASCLGCPPQANTKEKTMKRKQLRYLVAALSLPCLLASFTLLMTKVVLIASDSGLVTIDPNNRTVTTSNFSVAWSTTRDVEAITSIEWGEGKI